MHFDDAAAALISITVDGTEQTYETAVDANHDGVDDTVHVDTDQGSYEYTDTDGDGVADTLTVFDTDGQVTTNAVFDAAAGGWEVPSDSASPHAADALAGVGTPTIDSDSDGVADTAVAHPPDGHTVLATDTDADGAADVVTEIGPDGDFATYDQASDGAWHETGHGNLGEGRPPAAGPTQHAVTDPATGTWIRR